MVTIYILKCEDDKYYVGKIASNVWKRIKQHFDGKGAKWTQKYKPVDILDIRRGMTDRDESKVTLDMMKIFGALNCSTMYISHPTVLFAGGSDMCWCWQWNQ